MVELKTQQILISSKTTIGDVIKKYPSAIETLTKQGIQCSGCGVSYTETLEQGFESHGMGKEQVEKILSELNQLAEQDKGNEGKTLVITEKAIAKLHGFFKDHGGDALRIGISAGGCAGFSYDLTIAKEKQADEDVIEEGGVKVFVTKDALEQIKGAKVDYVESLQGAGFKISNPNATSSCGCGQSFR